MTAPRHDYRTGPCPHPDCGGTGTGAVTGHQCIDCGHYYPRSRVRYGADSEPHCRKGMGCDAAPTLGHAIRRRTQGGAR